MRYRIGYGGPKEYRHGQHFPGGRRNNGGMTEIERLIHLIASMQILFGSRRGGLLIPLLIVGVLVGGWFLYRHYYSPDVALERAHQMWDSNDTKQQIKAIAQYRVLLQKKDPIENGRNWLMDDRDTLYRRIIQHDVIFSGDKIKAAEWCLKAWDEGIRDLRFPDQQVTEFWEETTASSRQKNILRNKSERNRSQPDPALAPQSGLSSSARFTFTGLLYRSDQSFAGELPINGELFFSLGLILGNVVSSIRNSSNRRQSGAELGAQAIPCRRRDSLNLRSKDARVALNVFLASQVLVVIPSNFR